METLGIQRQIAGRAAHHDLARTSGLDPLALRPGPVLEDSSEVGGW